MLLAQVRHPATQFGKRDQCLLICGDQAFHASLQPRLALAQAVFAFPYRVRIPCGLDPAIDFVLDQRRIVQQPDHCSPDERIEIILPYRPILTDGSLEPTISIRADTSVIVDLPFGGPCRGTVQRIATLLTHQHPLQQRRIGRTAGRVTLVVVQLFLGQSEGGLAHKRGNRNLDPVRAGPLMVGTVTARHTILLPQRPRDALAGPQLGLSETRLSLIGRIPEHAPNRGTLPPRGRGACRDLPFVQLSRNRIDAESLDGIGIKHHAHDFGFRLDHLVIGVPIIALLDVSIPVRRAGENIDDSLLRFVPFAAPCPFRDLGPFILGNHALKLYQEFIFGRFT